MLTRKISICIIPAVALANCAIAPETKIFQSSYQEVALKDVVADNSHTIYASRKLMIRGKVFKIAERSIHLTEPKYNLPAGEKIPADEVCLDLALSAVQAEKVKSKRVYRIYGHLRYSKPSPGNILMSITISGRQIHPMCQYGSEYVPTFFVDHLTQ